MAVQDEPISVSRRLRYHLGPDWPFDELNRIEVSGIEYFDPSSRAADIRDRDASLTVTEFEESEESSKHRLEVVLVELMAHGFDEAVTFHNESGLLQALHTSNCGMKESMNTLNEGIEYLLSEC
jgi:hypothetical protein